MLLRCLINFFFSFYLSVLFFDLFIFLSLWDVVLVRLVMLVGR